jgi:hypothetical protein
MLQAICPFPFVTLPPPTSKIGNLLPKGTRGQPSRCTLLLPAVTHRAALQHTPCAIAAALLLGDLLQRQGPGCQLCLWPLPHDCVPCARVTLLPAQSQNVPTSCSTSRLLILLQVRSKHLGNSVGAHLPRNDACHNCNAAGGGKRGCQPIRAQQLQVTLGSSGSNWTAPRQG